MKLIPIEDWERWPVKVIAFFVIYFTISRTRHDLKFLLTKDCDDRHLAQVLLIVNEITLTKRRI